MPDVYILTKKSIGCVMLLRVNAPLLVTDYHESMKWHWIDIQQMFSGDILPISPNVLKICKHIL